jgi:hypothetical protein
MADYITSNRMVTIDLVPPQTRLADMHFSQIGEGEKEITILSARSSQIM